MATKKNKARTKATKKTKKETDGSYTHIAVVLDRSGSMNSTKDDTIGGFQTFLDDQKEVDGKATISIYQFDDQYDAICTMQDIQECVGIADLYQPRGMTALFDAIGQTINNTDEAVDKMDEKEAPEKIICVIITDGGENASQRFSQNIINDMIAARREGEWEFVFIGANQDSFSVGGGMGVRAASTMNYNADSVGTQALYRKMSDKMSSTRSKSFDAYKSSGFFEDDEDTEKAEDKTDADAIDVDMSK